MEDLVTPELMTGRFPSSLCCRSCDKPLRHTVVDLGMSPLANAYLRPEDLVKPEVFYPLCTYLCDRCWLMQLPEAQKPEDIFSDYAYFSSYSTSWLDHARRYTATMIERLALGAHSRVVEIASNDGYLLQYFRAADIPVLGVEPAANVAAVAEANGIPSRVEFFGASSARAIVGEGLRADLLIGNNVFAHVPAINDFAEGLATLLAPTGVLTLEFPHLLHLLQEDQFDTIYHEHYSYLSLHSARTVLDRHGLTVFDVDELPTHGGSLRLYARHKAHEALTLQPRVQQLLAREEAAGLTSLTPYRAFAERVRRVKRNLLQKLIDIRRQGRSVAGYGAPAKGNTLLNFCGIGTDLLDFTVDRSPHKQGHYLPGSRIPILAPEHIEAAKPDYLLILPWNLKSEIMAQMAHVADWGCRFLVAVPDVEELAVSSAPPNTTPSAPEAS